jgi:RNA polymerase sigma-70 factor (ECF subfamily)
VAVDTLERQAERFEENRTYLRSVAFRMLGSRSAADDAVQETWLRLARSDAGDIANLRSWLTAVVARVCLDVLRARKSRREDPYDVATRSDEPAADMTPEQQTLFTDSMGAALLVVLETLAPAERVAFVLHDMFDLGFDQIAAIVGRSPAAARQLASRARRRVQRANAASEPDALTQRHIVDAFLAASRDGNFDALLAVLDPDVVVRADGAAVQMGALAEVRGAAAVAATFKGRARAAEPVVVNGAHGLVWAHDGQPRVVFTFTIRGGRIAAVQLTGDPEQIRRFDIHGC